MSIESDPMGQSPLIELAIMPFEDAEIDEDIVIRTMEETTVLGRLYVTNHESSCTYRLALPPQNGQADVNSNGSFSYTPYEEFVGMDPFVLQIRRADGIEKSARITVFVDVVDEQPICIHPHAKTIKNRAVESHVVIPHADRKLYTYGIASTPANGSVILHADGSFVYTPHPQFTGNDLFTVYLKSNTGDIEVGKIFIQVVEETGEQPDNRKVIAEELTAVQTVNIAEQPLTMQEVLADLQIQFDQQASEKRHPKPSSSYETSPQFQQEQLPMHPSTHEEVREILQQSLPVKTSQRIRKVFARTDSGVPVIGNFRDYFRKGSLKSYYLLKSPQHGITSLNKSGKWVYEPFDGYVGKDWFAVLTLDKAGTFRLLRVTIQMREVEDE